MPTESKFGLLTDEPGYEEAENELEVVMATFLKSLLEIEKKYPEVGLSDTEVRDSVIQEIVNRFP